MIGRRGFITGLVSLVAAPAIVRTPYPTGGYYRDGKMIYFYFEVANPVLLTFDDRLVDFRGCIYDQ